MAEAAETTLEKTASGPWTDLALTLPIFVAYHLGVVFLPVRNAARSLVNAVRLLRRGKLSRPDAALRDPRPK